MLAGKQVPDDRPLIIRAVESIYDASLSPQLWPEALQAIADCFDDFGANLTFQRPDGHFDVFVSPRLKPGLGEYARDWAHRDLRAIRIAERSSLLVKKVVTDLDLVTADEMASDPFYTRFLAKFGLKWFAVANIAPNIHFVAGLSIQRTADKTSHSPREQDLLARLARHVGKSLTLSHQLIEAETAQTGLSHVLDRVGHGVFILDRHANVLWRNEAAQRVIGRGLVMVGERLACANAADQEQISAKLATLGNSSAPNIVPLGHRGKSRHKHAIYLLPLQGKPGAAPFARGHAVVVVPPDPSETWPDASLIRDLFGVSLGEARVASLIAAGLSPRETSLKLAVTEESVRTVLKRVFAKVGVVRQNELAALIAKLILPARMPSKAMRPSRR